MEGFTMKEYNDYDMSARDLEVKSVKLNFLSHLLMMGTLLWLFLSLVFHAMGTFYVAVPLTLGAFTYCFFAFVKMEYLLCKRLHKEKLQ